MQALIDEAVRSERVTAIVAPSGFGKTSAVSTWAAEKVGRVAWITLGAFDSDPIRLGGRIVQAIQSLARAGACDPSVLTIDPDTRDVAGTFDILMDAMDESTEPVYLVIDDAHRAGEALTNGLLGAIVDAGPSSLRVVILGTTFVELALARWVLASPSMHIRAEQLAFTLDEIAAIPMDGGSRLSPEKMLAETRGWPIAVRFLLMTGVRPRLKGNDEGLLQEYIGEYVLGAVPAVLSEFVLNTSVCADITVDLAVAVSGRQDAAAMLRECSKIGLFIDRFDTEKGVVYRWNSMFARHCRNILDARFPGRQASLHRLAGRHLEAADPLKAVSHWLAAGDPDEAVRVLLSRWVGVVVGLQAASLETICAGLPVSHTNIPSILLIRACAQDVGGEHDSARRLFARAEALFAAGTPDAAFAITLPRAQLFLLDDRAAVTKAYAAVQRQVEIADKEYQYDQAALNFVLGWTAMRHRNNPSVDHTVQLLSSAAREAESLGDHDLRYRSLDYLAFVLAWGGRMGEATQIIEQLGDRVDDDSPWLHYVGSGAGVAAGYVAYWANDLNTAKKRFADVIRSGGSQNPFAGVARMMFALAAAASKDLPACRRAGIELRNMPINVSQGISWPPLRATAVAILEEVRHRRQQALLIATQYAEETGLPLVTVTLAGIVRRSGNPRQALEMLRRLTRYEAISYVRVATLATASISQRRQGNRELAHELCEQALEVGEAETVLRPFCDQDLEMLQLLTEHIAWGTRHEEFIARCLTVNRNDGTLALLSKRENAVFQQLRTTRTTAEIAAALNVSINTVKTHQRSIYRKLGVSSRKEATRRFT